MTLANALHQRGHQVEVICLKQVGSLAVTLDPSIRVTCLNKPEGLAVGALSDFTKAVRKVKPDVLHSHDWGVYIDSMAASWRAGVPSVVHTVHGAYMASGAGMLAATKRRLRHAAERWFAKRGGSIVCVSDALREQVEAEVGIPACDLKAIPNGVEVPPNLPAPPLDQSGRLRLLAIGRLAEVKNFPLMIRAFARIASVEPRVQLQIAGDGPERGALQRLIANLSLGGRVELLGFRADTEELIANSYAVLLSSDSEGIPMAILEAMRGARAVISTQVGGAGQLITQDWNGLLVPAKDEEAYAAAMLKVLGDPDFACKMGERGFAIVSRRFSLDSMVEAYTDLYQAGTKRQSGGEGEHGSR